MSHRETFIHQRAAHTAALHQEAARVILFGSLAHGDTAHTSDLDLLIVWDTPLDYLARTVDLYRRLKPRAPVDMLVYTPAEMLDIADRPFVRRILEEGKVLYAA